MMKRMEMTMTTMIIFVMMMTQERQAEKTATAVLLSRLCPIEQEAQHLILRFSQLRLGGKIRIMHAHALETYYGHNSKNLVEKGQTVKAGQAIAIVGQTGRATTPHLHFETRVNGKHKNPSKYIKLTNQTK